MRESYRLFRRRPGGRFNLNDGVTGKQESLGTDDRTQARRLVHSRNEAEQQPAVNLQIARAYLAATDPQIATRTWRYVMDELVRLKRGETKHRWGSATKDRAHLSLLDLPVLETGSEHFLQLPRFGKVSTNVYLRRVHNFTLDMSRLPWPMLPKRC